GGGWPGRRREQGGRCSAVELESTRHSRRGVWSSTRCCSPVGRHFSLHGLRTLGGSSLSVLLWRSRSLLLVSWLTVPALESKHERVHSAGSCFHGGTSSRQACARRPLLGRGLADGTRAGGGGRHPGPWSGGVGRS